MDEIIERDPSDLMNQKPKIGNMVLTYPEGDKPFHVQPLVMKDGRIVLLTSIIGVNRRVILQDLTGAEIKTLLYPDNCNAYCTADKDNIYVFESKMEAPKLYVFDAETFELKKRNEIERSKIQNVCCDGENLYTFDAFNKQIQVRDKDGNIKQVKSVPPSQHFLISSSNGIYPINVSDIKVSIGSKEELASRFGRELVDSNVMYKDIAYDEDMHTLYVASEKIVYVATPQGMKGIMYFQDKFIMGIDFDPTTSSLAVSSVYQPDDVKLVIPNTKGFVEIIPSDMVNKRIQESSELLESKYHKETLKQIGYDIAQIADGDFDIMVYLSEQAKEMGVNIKSILDDLKGEGLTLDEIRKKFEDERNTEITPAEIAGSVWKSLGLDDKEENIVVPGEIDDPQG